MSEMIAYCGLDCAKCRAFKATQAKDFERKKQIAKQWTEGLKVEFKPEDIDCNGCMSNVISGWCRKICKIRPCAEERKVKTCAHCNDYPCGKLKELLSNESVATENLEKIRKTRRVE
jgi:DNA modification methylase